MYIWMKSIRRPALTFAQNCLCQNNIHLQKTVLFQVSFCRKNYFMSDISNVKENPITPGSFLLQKNIINFNAVSEQGLSSLAENKSSTENKPNQPQSLTENKPNQPISENKPNQPPTEDKPLSNKDKLKRAVKDYGATVIVFHVTISLMSLGVSYLVISSGVDVASLLASVGLDTQSHLAAGASTFVVAYAVHKVFAPVRISITLAATPFIVRYLRRIGILKPPKTK